jgi:predicted phosphodiesterase
MLSGYEGDEYTFLVGADSHLTTDDGRMREMLQIALDNNDLLMAHLGDIADTKAEYYIILEDLIDEYREKYAKKYYAEQYLNDEKFSLDQVSYPFYPVVGNHDITHNGWALWSNIFHSSFYDVYVLVNLDPPQLDHFIFLDSASGTLGREQVRLLEEGVLNDYYDTGEKIIRHTFVFSHTNIFRPRSVEFASTFPREEMFFLLNKFSEWETDMVFLGHVHKWDYQKVGDTEYLTLDSMCEANNPQPGDYLVRVHVKKDGTISWEKVRMNYTKK